MKKRDLTNGDERGILTELSQDRGANPGHLENYIVQKNNKQAKSILNESKRRQQTQKSKTTKRKQRVKSSGDAVQRLNSRV